MNQYLDLTITGLFFLCSVVIYLNVAALLRDRTIKGVSVWPMIVFFLVDCLQAVRFVTEGSYPLAVGAFSMCVASGSWLCLAAFFMSRRVSQTTPLSE
ncbi:hypothetical protein vBCbaSRXM_100 [Citromicrobium phage vB_CbaS-RXM]|nr:hypothetical protein vBCbaSRXM_100 [Citromicrobium phage vB_CbaS-RXM]